LYTPDRAIRRKVKEYDSALYFSWNEKREYFELWRKMENGKRVIITPITKSIYDTAAPIEFTPLDERIVWWLYSADSWRNGGHKNHALESDKRWIEQQKKMDRNRRETYYDLAKDTYRTITAFYSTKHQSKNKKPTFNSSLPVRNWMRPDVKSKTAKRVFYRSAQNARSYNWSKP
jgi:hypothetical protein